MNEQNLILVNDLTTDLIRLKQFIALLETQKDAAIESMQILFNNDVQINLKGRFSNDSRNKLMDIILLSRNQLVCRLESILNEINEQGTVYPINTLKVVLNQSDAI